MKTRILQTKFWDDDFIFDLDPKGKLLFIYLISNSTIGLTGAYELSIRRVSYETGLSLEEIRKYLDKFKDKILWVNERWFVLLNARKYNNYASNIKLQTAYQREYDRLPDPVKQHVENIGLSLEKTKKYKKGNSKNYRHREIAEQILGRSLTENEVVHHIDRNIENNDISNLAVMPKETHTALHQGKVGIEDTTIILLSYYSDTRHKYKIKNNKYKIKNIKQKIINNTGGDFKIFLEKFNQLYQKNYQETSGRVNKYKTRLKTYTAEQILTALDNMAKIPFYQGNNDRGWVPDPDYILRSDEIIDRLLNQKQAHKKTFASENTDRFANL